MKGLILDTSGEAALIALSDQGHLIHHALLPSLRSSSFLAGYIQNTLQEATLSLHDLSYIGIGIGPGSFLGTRIGVTLAKTLAYGIQIPLVSFCSLQAYQPVQFTEFAVITDAKSKGIYLLKGSKNFQTICYESAPLLYSIEEFLFLEPTIPLFITPHELSLRPRLPSLGDKLLETPLSLPYLCKHCMEQFLTSHQNAMEELPIHYLRLS